MTVRADRIAKGQCPNDGLEAAPYLLCPKCRFRGKITRVLNRAEKAGGFKTTQEGRAKLWSMGDQAALDAMKWRADPKPGDRRCAPRLRGVRIDFEATLIEVMRHLNRPVTLEEIMAAWGRLRDRRTDPLPADLSRIIIAQERRARKMAKRSALSSAVTEELR